MTDPNLESCESGAHFAHPGEPCEEPEQAPTPPAGALRDAIAEAVHATSLCEVGDPARCGGGCRDAADAVLATPELAQRLAHLADYENRITWETNCGEHARLLDSCYAETVRAEKAEAELRRDFARKRAEQAEERAGAPRGAHGPGHPLWDALESAIWAAGRPSDRNALRAVLPIIEQHTAQLRAGRATWKAKAEEIERDRDRLDDELARVSALHADTERRLTVDLAAEVRKREAAQAEAVSFADDLSATLRRINEVRQLHRPYDDNREQIKRCVTCASREAYSNGVAIHEPWPCPTVRALDTPKENPHD